MGMKWNPGATAADAMKEKKGQGMDGLKIARVMSTRDMSARRRQPQHAMAGRKTNVKGASSAMLTQNCKTDPVHLDRGVSKGSVELMSDLRSSPFKKYQQYGRVASWSNDGVTVCDAGQVGWRWHSKVHAAACMACEHRDTCGLLTTHS